MCCKNVYGLGRAPADCAHHVLRHHRGGHFRAEISERGIDLGAESLPLFFGPLAVGQAWPGIMKHDFHPYY